MTPAETATPAQLTAAIALWTNCLGKGTADQQRTTEREVATLKGRLAALKFARLSEAYSGLLFTFAEVATSNALDAVRAGTCESPVVIFGLECLDADHARCAAKPDIERAERYVEECWREYLSTRGPEEPGPDAGGAAGGGAKPTYVLRVGALTEHLSCYTLEQIAERYRPGLPSIELVKRGHTTWQVRNGGQIVGSLEQTGGFA